MKKIIRKYQVSHFSSYSDPRRQPGVCDDNDELQDRITSYLNDIIYGFDECDEIFSNPKIEDIKYSSAYDTAKERMVYSALVFYSYDEEQEVK